MTNSSTPEMASSKRGEAPTLSGDTPVRKRARLSDEFASAPGSTRSESEDREESDIEYREGSSDYLEDEDEDTQQATQLILERRGIVMDNMPQESGIIESVTCMNFMCHTKLHVPFGPLINFIIGHNGSGKSAVLTALTLCLGGKAATTNRGQSLKSFIKNGEDSAVLIVKLKNGGINAYQEEVYGDMICIERHFSRAGASGFKIKSATGRIISTKRFDLEEICDYYALQLDNPMNVLTQDMARQFLSNSSPADKYKFFVRGVHLEQLDQDYKLLEESTEKMEAKLESRVADVKALEERASKAAGRLALSDRQDTLRQKIRGYGRQMAWAQVEEQEQVLQSLEADVRRAQERIQEAEQSVEGVDEAFQEASRTVELAQGEIEEIRKTAAPLIDAKAEVLERFEQNKGTLLCVQSEHRTIRQHLTAVHARIERTNKDIEAERARLDNVNGGAQARKAEALAEARAKAIDAKVEFDSHREARAALDRQLYEAQQHNQNLSPPIAEKKAELDNCQRTMQSLQRDQGQHMAAFHERMPLLLRAIRDDDRFREKPVGPVGNHIRLLKPEWSSILEKALGGTLSSFIVTSMPDQSLLSDVMKRVNCVCPILIGNHQRIDTTQFEPDPRFETALRVLEIDSELVRRQLIINQAIEQTLLIKDWAEASRVLYDGPKPRNVKQCFCLHKDRRGWGMRLGYGRGVEPTSSPMPPMNGRPRMKTDAETQIRIQRENLQHLKQEYMDLQGHARAMDERVRQCEHAIVRHRQQQDELLLGVQRAEDLAEQRQDELERDTVQDGRLDALVTGLKEAEEEKTMHEGSYQEAIISKGKLNEVASQLRAEMGSLDEQMKDIEARAKKFETKALKLTQARHAALERKNRALQAIDDAKKDEGEVEDKRQAQANLTAGWAVEAGQICARVPVDPGETAESLDKKLVRLTQDLKRFEQEIGASRETIAHEAAETRMAYKTAQRQFRELRRIAMGLKLSLKYRQDRWKQFRRYISARARGQFIYLLSERGFRGTLKTDHDLQELELHVEPDETRANAKGRQTKTLSGGEKSFSTICLLLALWEAMGSPIRCLDEFDVFMDNVNRDVSLKMMIGTARRSVGKQYVLITPQSMGNVDVAGDVKIIKLSDPERGQTTLPYSS